MVIIFQMLKTVMFPFSVVCVRLGRSAQRGLLFYTVAFDSYLFYFLFGFQFRGSSEREVVPKLCRSSRGRERAGYVLITVHTKLAKCCLEWTWIRGHVAELGYPSVLRQIYIIGVSTLLF